MRVRVFSGERMGISQIQGAIFEEVVAVLLGNTGYRRVTSRHYGIDDTISINGNGEIFVEGRGAQHQVDVLMDFPFTPSFNYPIRMFVEAKCYREENTIPIHIVRNAVGTLKDIQEFWTRQMIDNAVTLRRHYCYTLFSTSDFSKPAIEYGYSQGIFLVSLSNQGIFQGMFECIYELSSLLSTIGISTKKARFLLRDRKIRNQLDEKINSILSILDKNIDRWSFITIGMLNGQVPVAFIPDGFRSLSEIENGTKVRVRFDGGQWFLESDQWEGKRLLFKMPMALFLRASGNPRQKFIDIKENWFKKIDFIHYENRNPRAFQLVIDEEWFDEIKRKVRDGEIQ